MEKNLIKIQDGRMLCTCCGAELKYKFKNEQLLIETCPCRTSRIIIKEMCERSQHRVDQEFVKSLPKILSYYYGFRAKYARDEAMVIPSLKVIIAVLKELQDNPRAKFELDCQLFKDFYGEEFSAKNYFLLDEKIFSKFRDFEFFVRKARCLYEELKAGSVTLDNPSYRQILKSKFFCGFIREHGVMLFLKEKHPSDSEQIERIYEEIYG